MKRGEEKFWKVKDTDSKIFRVKKLKRILAND